MKYIGRELTKKITEEACSLVTIVIFAGKPGDEEARVRIIMSSSEKEAMDRDRGDPRPGRIS